MNKALNPFGWCFRMTPPSDTARRQEICKVHRLLIWRYHFLVWGPNTSTIQANPELATQPQSIATQHLVLALQTLKPI